MTILKIIYEYKYTAINVECILYNCSSPDDSSKEGWVREGGREGDARGKRYGDICICIADSLCSKAETNTPL